jgi:DNA replication protein DnaC
MLREQTFEKLYRLKLHGMAQALGEQLQQPESASLGFEERLAGLVDAQWLWRENRAIATRLRQARLKQPASLEDINYRHPRQLDRTLLRSLASCDWVRQRHNITITGPAGVGKTYLCCALLEKACREGFTAYYAAAAKFFRQLAIAYADGSFDRLLGKWARLDVLAIDDWGLTPLSDTERRHLLEVLEDRGGTRSTVLTSQFPIETWHDLVGSPTLADAILERILSNHHEIALKGETLRPVRKASSDLKTVTSSQKREEET